MLIKHYKWSVIADEKRAERNTHLLSALISELAYHHTLIVFLALRKRKSGLLVSNSPKLTCWKKKWLQLQDLHITENGKTPSITFKILRLCHKSQIWLNLMGCCTPEMPLRSTRRRCEPQIQPSSKTSLLPKYNALPSMNEGKRGVFFLKRSSMIWCNETITWRKSSITLPRTIITQVW